MSVGSFSPHGGRFGSDSGLLVFLVQIVADVVVSVPECGCCSCSSSSSRFRFVGGPVVSFGWFFSWFEVWFEFSIVIVSVRDCCFCYCFWPGLFCSCPSSSSRFRFVGGRVASFSLCLFALFPSALWLLTFRIAGGPVIVCLVWIVFSVFVF